MSRPGSRRAALGIAAALLVVSHGGSGAGREPPGRSPFAAYAAPATSAAITAEPVADAKTKAASEGPTTTLGRLTFAPCELAHAHSAATTYARCATLAVPEDRAHPDARTLALKVALIRSDAADPKPDPVVFLAGGPGQAATESYSQIASALALLRRHRAIVLMDQRGTGGSNPLDCKPLPTRPDEERPPATSESLVAETARCVAELRERADPRFYTTSDAVADLEDLRVALDAPQLNLIGVSYGTRLAEQYAQRHRDGVRSLVLDGVVPNELVLGSDFARNLDAALKARFAACAAVAPCEKRFGDSYATLYALYDALRATPQRIELRDPTTFALDTRVLDADRLGSLVRLYAYSPETSALLPLALAEAKAGRYAPLLAQAEIVGGELADSLTGGLQLSVICAEDVDLLRDRPEDAKLILGGDFVRDIQAQCAVWPHGGRPTGFHSPLASDVPTLLLSGEVDPVTPPRYGAQVAKTLSRARHLVAPGQGHNVIGRGCLPRLVRTFVETLVTDTLDAGCVADLGATETFLDYNGALP